MTSARVRTNLEKWGGTGETPKQFIERMTTNITAMKNNGLRFAEDQIENAKSEKARRFYEDDAERIMRKIRKLEREIRKAEMAI